MEEKQRVYIQGVPGRGKEVIHTLVNLGGINSDNLYGENNKYYYYITSNNKINRIFIIPTVKSLFKELLQKIKLPRWKPQYGDTYYYIISKGSIITDVWYEQCSQKDHYKFGNCFRTYKEAETLRDKIKQMLNK